MATTSSSIPVGSIEEAEESKAGRSRRGARHEQTMEQDGQGRRRELVFSRSRENSIRLLPHDGYGRFYGPLRGPLRPVSDDASRALQGISSISSFTTGASDVYEDLGHVKALPPRRSSRISIGATRSSSSAMPGWPIRSSSTTLAVSITLTAQRYCRNRVAQKDQDNLPMPSGSTPNAERYWRHPYKSRLSAGSSPCSS